VTGSGPLGEKSIADALHRRANLASNFRATRTISASHPQLKTRPDFGVNLNQNLEPELRRKSRLRTQIDPLEAALKPWLCVSRTSRQVKSRQMISRSALQTKSALLEQLYYF